MNIKMLSLEAELLNGKNIINPVVIWDEKDLILVDAGLPGSYSKIKEESEKLKIPFHRLNKIIITHSDMDHIGGLAGIIKNFENKIEVYSHKEEKKYIECESPPIRLSQMEKSLENLSGEILFKMTTLCNDLKSNYNELLFLSSF